MSSAERLIKLEARLEQIDDAIAALTLGQQVYEMTNDGRTVRYTPANLDHLGQLEARTKLQIARLKGESTGYGRKRMSY